MSDDDYANVEDFPLINAEQPEPVLEAGWGCGINIVVRVWQQQQSDETSLSSEAFLSSTFSRNIEHRATGHWVTAHGRVASC